MTTSVTLSNMELMQGIKTLLNLEDTPFNLIDTCNNSLLLITFDAAIKIHQIHDWIYIESKYLSIVIDVVTFINTPNNNVQSNTLNHFVEHWDTWSNIFQNCGYHVLGKLQQPVQGKYTNTHVSFEIGTMFNVMLCHNGQICVQKRGCSCYFTFTDSNREFVIKHIKDFINRVTFDELIKILPIENVKASCYVDRLKSGECLLPSNFIDVTLAINNDNYINFLITFDNSHIDSDTIKINDIVTFSDVEDCIYKLKEIMTMANTVVSLNDEALESSPAHFIDLYRKIKADTRILNEEIERLQRTADLFCKRTVQQQQQQLQDLDADQPDLSDLIQSEDYTQAFLKQICCIECIKDPTLIQYVEPTTKVDKYIQKYILATIKNKTSKLLEFTDIMQVLKALIV